MDAGNVGSVETNFLKWPVRQSDLCFPGKQKMSNNHLYRITGTASWWLHLYKYTDYNMDYKIQEQCSVQDYMLLLRWLVLPFYSSGDIFTDIQSWKYFSSVIKCRSAFKETQTPYSISFNVKGFSFALIHTIKYPLSYLEEWEANHWRQTRERIHC